MTTGRQTRKLRCGKRKLREKAFVACWQTAAQTPDTQTTTDKTFSTESKAKERRSFATNLWARFPPKWQSVSKLDLIENTSDCLEIPPKWQWTLDLIENTSACLVLHGDHLSSDLRSAFRSLVRETTSDIEGTQSCCHSVLLTTKSYHCMAYTYLAKNRR